MNWIIVTCVFLFFLPQQQSKLQEFYEVLGWFLELRGFSMKDNPNGFPICMCWIYFNCNNTLFFYLFIFSFRKTMLLDIRLAGLPIVCYPNVYPISSDMNEINTCDFKVMSSNLKVSLHFFLISYQNQIFSKNQNYSIQSIYLLLKYRKMK